MSLSVTGQVVLITGAGRGIGRSLAIHLAERGANIGLLARTSSQVADTASVCEAAGSAVVALTADVTDRAAVAAAVARIESTLGPIDLAVANAGTEGPREPLWEAGADSWWNTVEVNLGGPIAVAAAVLPGMVARARGRLVMMNSLIGTRNDPIFGAYAVSKAGLGRLVGVLGSTLGGTGVSVFDVSPGLVRTAMTDVVFADQRVLDDDWTPVARICNLVEAISRGDLDALSGRFVHALDDWAALAARSDEIVSNDGRTQGMKPAFVDDPLF